MTAEFSSNEAVIRLSVFFSLFVALVVWEFALPRRPLSVAKGVRWIANLSLVVINTFAARLLVPITAVAFASVVDLERCGLFSMLPLPAWLTILLGVVVLDLAIYFQHQLFHAVPALWRLHKVHHTDLDFDVTTGVRFHPLEIVLSMAIKLAVICVFGPGVIAVLIFEILLNATSMFNHSNIYLPAKLDRVLRWVVVTPDMHRVHHSVLPREFNANFGFNLPWWDRLFGTYRSEPQQGHLGMSIGQPGHREADALTLPRLLALPFAGAVGRGADSQRAD